MRVGLYDSSETTIDFHLCQLKLHCRFYVDPCWSTRKAVEKASHPRVYFVLCSAIASELHTLMLWTGWSADSPTFVLQALLRRDAAQAKGSESTSPFQQPHGAIQVGSSNIRWWVQGEEQCSSNVNLYITYIQILGL